MEYKTLNTSTWKTLSNAGDNVTGHYGIWLTAKNEQGRDFLIFKDNHNKYHLVIANSTAIENDLYDPKVNGLMISLTKYKFKDAPVGQFIDLQCTLDAYLTEFTEIVKEICHKADVAGNRSVALVNDVLRRWKAFWSKVNPNLLSLEEQVGLMAEIFVLRQLIPIDSELAFRSWRGPLGEVHDFVFARTAVEVKGKLGTKRVHTINGLEQLQPPNDKRLFLHSCLLSRSYESNASSLPDIVSGVFSDLHHRPDLIERFRELLINKGYNFSLGEFYNEFRFIISESRLYEVNDDFPKLTHDSIRGPLDHRLTSIRYDVHLDTIGGEYPIEWNKYMS